VISDLVLTGVLGFAFGLLIGRLRAPVAECPLPHPKPIPLPLYQVDDIRKGSPFVCEQCQGIGWVADFHVSDITCLGCHAVYPKGGDKI
jgi:hypothetical protein